jgi:hypothetical protein
MQDKRTKDFLVMEVSRGGRLADAVDQVDQVDQWPTVARLSATSKKVLYKDR